MLDADKVALQYGIAGIRKTHLPGGDYFEGNRLLSWRLLRGKVLLAEWKVLKRTNGKNVHVNIGRCLVGHLEWP